MPRKPSIRKTNAQTAEVPPVKTEIASTTGSVEQVVPANTADGKSAPVAVKAALANAKPLAKAAAAASASSTVRPGQDAIRQRAYEIYQQRGSTGNAVEDWLRAERELLASGDHRKPA